MRWMAGFVCLGMALIGLLGCGRVQRGEGGGQVSLASERPRIPKPKVEGSKPSPAMPTAAATTATVSPTLFLPRQWRLSPLQKAIDGLAKATLSQG